MKALRWLLLFIMVAVTSSTGAQVSKKTWYDSALFVTIHYFDKDYQSALRVSNFVISVAEKQGYQSDSVFSLVLKETAHTYDKLGNLSKAHEFYTRALSNSRKYSHLLQEMEAFNYLNQLHADIVKKNLPFRYTPPATTYQDTVVYLLENVEKRGDSLLLTFYGGSLDGITDSSGTADLYSSEDDSLKQSLTYLGSARIIKITPNRTIAIMERGRYDAVPRDFAFIKAQVPIHFEKTALKKYIINYIFATDNYRQRVYDRRYFYYFWDPRADSTVMDIFKFNVLEIVDMYGKDTATNEMYNKMATEGLFKGRNMIQAMSDSRQQHLEYFLNFVAEFPGKYIGHDWKFSEIFATWIYNNTPLARKDVRQALLNAPNFEAMKKLANGLANTIKKEDLADEWLVTALREAQNDNLREAQKGTVLLYSLGGEAGLEKYNAWSRYLLGLVREKNDEIGKADTSYRTALNLFKKAGDKEGERWAQSAIFNLDKNKNVAFSVQSGHLVPYNIAMHPTASYFATGAEDHLIKIWDLSKAKEVKTITGHTEPIHSINYSPDGRYLASSDDSTIRIWNALDYSLLQTIKTNKRQASVKFTNDSRNILSAGRDSVVRLYDPITGDILKTYQRLHRDRITDLGTDPSNPNIFYTAGYDSMIYKWNISTGDTLAWFRHKSRVLDIDISNNGKYMSVVTRDSFLHVWNLPTFKTLFTDSIAVHRPGTGTLYYGEQSFSPDSRYIAYPFPGKQMRITNIPTLRLKTFWVDQEEYAHLSATQFSPDGNFLIQKYLMGGQATIIDFSDHDYTPDRFKTKELKQYNAAPFYVQFNKGGDKLFVVTDANYAYNLANGKTEYLYIGWQQRHRSLWMNNENYSLQGSGRGAAIWDLKTKSYKDAIMFRLPAGEETQSVLAAFNDSIIYLGGNEGTLAARSIKKNDSLFTISFPQGEDSKIRYLTADSARQRILLSTGSGKVYAVDAYSGKKTDSVFVPYAFEIAVANNAAYVGGDSSIVYKLSLKDLSLQGKIKLPGWMVTENLDISPDGRHLAVNHNGNFLSLIELSTGRVVYTLKDREFISVGLDISPDGKLIATGGADNKVNLRDLNTGKLVAAIHTPREEDAVRTGNQGFVLADPQGYYMASKKALDGIVFQYKNSAFNYEQFDLQFNRPDIVLSTLGKADTALVRAYHTAYKKRLKKMGLTEEQVKTEIHKPITRIIDRLNVRPTTSSATYDVSVECYDGRYKLSKLHIVVNNTPLFGAAGKDLSHKDTTTVIEKINIPLSVGRNIISVSCVNENGSESLKQTFEILSNAKPEKKPKVYFVGIAVAKYKDSSMNLGYSVKDVRDLAATFKEIYPDLVIDTLIDKKVTRENILKLKKKLLQTGVNDKIIMAVTGHGLLSDSFDFYYATYDVNFNNPVKRGLKYDELENLLTDVPARQKLLLIDACHSGALDKEEMQNSVVQRNGVKTVNARSTIKIKQKKVSSYNVFDLMQNMFTDLSNNNGTVVISAAGGLEYAFESGKWNNGVFTYCVRKALTESYRMTVSELLTYVSNMVPQLTQGKQRPTSRRESLDHNWNLK